MVNTIIAVLLLVVTVAVTLNLVATVCVVKSAIYTGTQKSMQLAIVWVIPLIGAILVLSVWVHDRRAASRDPVRYGEGSWLPGMGPENGHRHHGDSMAEGGSNHGHGEDVGGSGH